MTLIAFRSQWPQSGQVVKYPDKPQKLSPAAAEILEENLLVNLAQVLSCPFESFSIVKPRNINLDHANEITQISSTLSLVTLAINPSQFPYPTASPSWQTTMSMTKLWGQKFALMMMT
jgi:hypothetical protein